MEKRRIHIFLSSQEKSQLVLIFLPPYWKMVPSIGRPKKRIRTTSRRSAAATIAASGAVIGATVHGANSMYTRQGRGSSHRSHRSRNSQFSSLEPLNASDFESLWDMPLPEFEDPTMDYGDASTTGHFSLPINHRHQPQQQLPGSQGRSADDAICLD